MPAPPATMRVLTLNTHKGFAAFQRRFVLRELREAIRSVGADVVFLQEVVGQQAGPAPVPAPHYEFLADTIWPEYAYGRNAVSPAGDHGNALLSKFPIVEQQNVHVADVRGERRGLLHCVLRVPGLSAHLHTVCVHLGLTERQRRAQARALAARVRATVSDRDPLVVAGDFNDWRQRVHRTMAGDGRLREAFATLHGRVARTFPARLPVLRLDRVYTRNLEPTRARVLADRPWSHLSDHASLVVELAL